MAILTRPEMRLPLLQHFADEPLFAHSSAAEGD